MLANFCIYQWFNNDLIIHRIIDRYDWSNGRMIVDKYIWFIEWYKEWYIEWLNNDLSFNRVLLVHTSAI
jgi:hypothetical protein